MIELSGLTVMDEILISFELPFSWQILFLASLFFALGTLLYSIFCPKIIQNFERSTNYPNEGYGYGYLKSHLDKIFFDLRDEEYTPIHVGCMLDRYFDFDDLLEDGDAGSEDIIWEKVRIRVQSEEIAKSDHQDIFLDLYDLYDFDEFSDFPKQSICSWCFKLGFFFFSIVAFQNIWAVIKTFF